MALAEREGERIIVRSEYREKDLIAQVPGSRWDRKRRIWSTPLSWAACVQLRGIFAADLEIGPDLDAFGWLERQRIDACMQLRTAEDAGLNYSKADDLFPFQRAGARFLVDTKCAALCDEMGLGKTIQAIAALGEIGPEAFPALVVCPNTMKRVWAYSPASVSAA